MKKDSMAEMESKREAKAEGDHISECAETWNQLGV